MSRPRIIGLSGNVTKPSRTAVLVGRTVGEIARRLNGHGEVVELADAAPHILSVLKRSAAGEAGEAVLRRVEAADVLVVGSPVYRASYTGAIKHLFDLVDFDALANKPVVLAATGGRPMHGLVTEHQLRPLLSFFRALTVPTALYAVESDFTDYALTNPVLEARIERAADEAATLVLANARGTPSLQLSVRG